MFVENLKTKDYETRIKTFSGLFAVWVKGYG